MNLFAFSFKKQISEIIQIYYFNFAKKRERKIKIRIINDSKFFTIIA